MVSEFDSGRQQGVEPQTVQQETERDEQQREAPDREMPCPICGHPMPDLKGGKATICPVCGFKDSCCY
jgi:hypothetical protein